MFAVSAGGIVALLIIVAVLIALAAFLVPRMNRAREERRLDSRRQEVAGRHRAEAEAREQRAELAEREAKRARAEAEIHEQEAHLHEQGMRDDRLTGDGAGGRFERDREVVDEREREPR